VFANIIAVPLLNAAVGFGLTGLIIGSTTLSSIAAWLVKLAETSVAWFARIEPGSRIPTPSMWLAVTFIVSLAVLAATLRKRPRDVLAPTLISLSLAAALYFYDTPPGRTGWLEVSTIDVAQGDSLLVVFPEGETMLVDGGGFPVFRGSVSSRRMDIGEQVVSPYLWNRGLRRIDIVVMTHAHEDHAQGLSAAIRNFRPTQLWTGAVSGPNALIEEALRYDVRVVHPRAGYTRRFGPATVRVLAPSPDYIPTATPRNNDSLVLEITYGRRRFLLTGDAERAVELELAANGTLQAIDVLKVGHHGSKSSTIPELLAVMRPQFAMISVGDGNLYGHPHPNVLSRLRDAHTQFFRTDLAGLTRFRTDGNRLLVETNSPDWAQDDR
jgi:competence protein ComEC